MWGRLPTPSLGLVPPGKSAWGQGDMGRACQSPWIVRWKSPTCPQPHIRRITPDGRTGHLPALEPQFAPQCTRQFAPHVPHELQPLGAGTSSSALLPQQPLRGKWWGAKLAAAVAEASAVPATMVVPESPTLTQPPTHRAHSHHFPTNSTEGSCGVSISLYHLLMHL